MQVIYGEIITLPTPTWPGHTFSGWFDGNTLVTSGVCTLFESTTLTAKWDAVSYKINYILNGGTNAVGNHFSYISEQRIVLEAPTKTGYTFTGWTYDGQTTPKKEVVIEYGSTGDKTFTANWTPNTYMITFDAKGGTVSPSSMTVTYDASFTLPTPVWPGHNFSGWYNGNTKVEDGVCKFLDNITLTAKWGSVNYTISYNLNGGENATGNPVGYISDQSVTLLAPSRTGYTFIGWTCDGQTTPQKQVTIPHGSVGNKTFTANWTPNTYTMTFDAKGGTVNPSSMTVTYDASFTLPTPVWPGHTFSGWYNGNTKVGDGICRFLENTTLTAKWDSIEYTISYELNGGTNDPANPSTFVSDVDVVLKAPSRVGYTFTGWTYKEQDTPQ